MYMGFADLGLQMQELCHPSLEASPNACLLNRREGSGFDQSGQLVSSHARSNTYKVADLVYNHA